MKRPRNVLKVLFSLAETLAAPLLRISMGVVLFWIGCIHIADLQHVVSLLSQSLSFLAFSALLPQALFAGTLIIFLIAPGATGFPLRTLMGQFLLKDTVLASAAITLIARDVASHEAKLAQRAAH